VQIVGSYDNGCPHWGPIIDLLGLVGDQPDATMAAGVSGVVAEILLRFPIISVNGIGATDEEEAPGHIRHVILFRASQAAAHIGCLTLGADLVGSGRSGPIPLAGEDGIVVDDARPLQSVKVLLGQGDEDLFPCRLVDGPVEIDRSLPTIERFFREDLVVEDQAMAPGGQQLGVSPVGRRYIEKGGGRAAAGILQFPPFGPHQQGQAFGDGDGAARAESAVREALKEEERLKVEMPGSLDVRERPVVGRYIGEAGACILDGGNAQAECQEFGEFSPRQGAVRVEVAIGKAVDQASHLEQANFLLAEVAGQVGEGKINGREG